MTSGGSRHFKGLCDWVIDKITTRGVGDESQITRFPLVALTLIVSNCLRKSRPANMTDSASVGNALAHQQQWEQRGGQILQIIAFPLPFALWRVADDIHW